MDNGVCSYLFDPDKALVVSDAWAQDIVALGATWVRVVIKGDQRNSIDWESYKAALGVFQRAGLKVCALLDLDWNRPWLEGSSRRAIYPNEALGYGGNQRQNRFIKDCVRRAQDTAERFGALVDAYAVWNEPNLQALLPIGANVPPANSDKAPAMAPEIFYSLGWEVAQALRAGGAKLVYLGALSWLPSAGMNSANPYCAGYMRVGLAYLRSTGAHSTPWDAVMVNSEGWWTVALAKQMQAAINAALTRYKVLDAHDNPLPLVIGEWSQKESALPGHEAEARQTYTALTGISVLAFYFSYQAAIPNDATTFGARLWTVSNGMFYPSMDPLAWYILLRELFHA